MSRGRGHTKESESPATAKVGVEHGQFIIRLPKKLQKIGIKLGDEVVVDPCNTNLLNWEVTIRRKPKS